MTESKLTYVTQEIKNINEMLVRTQIAGLEGSSKTEKIQKIMLESLEKEQKKLQDNLIRLRNLKI